MKKTLNMRNEYEKYNKNVYICFRTFYWVNFK